MEFFDIQDGITRTEPLPITGYQRKPRRYTYTYGQRYYRVEAVPDDQPQPWLVTKVTKYAYSAAKNYVCSKLEPYATNEQYIECLGVVTGKPVKKIDRKGLLAVIELPRIALVLEDIHPKVREWLCIKNFKIVKVVDVKRSDLEIYLRYALYNPTYDPFPSKQVDGFLSFAGRLMYDSQKIFGF